MKLFISYSRDDKAWVYELWRALRDRAHHDAWIDQRLIPAQDWWESILHNIETAECCIYVMTPKSVESIYCAAEVEYALALNKPIIPLMLKSCDTPTEIRKRRIQYSTISDSDSLGDVLFTVTQALSEIRVGLIQGKFAPPGSLSKRPDEPMPARKPEQVSEVFMLAEEAAHANNFTLAEKLFQQVIDADPQGYGLAAAERLGEIRYERARDQDYVNIVQMASHPAMRKGAQALWRVFVGKYGMDYDPNGIGTVLVSQPLPALRQSDPVQEALERARTFQGKRNRDWTPFLVTFNDLNIPDMTFCLVPVGSFQMGEGKEAHPQTISQPYYIAQDPVTNAQWAVGVKAGVVKKPEEDLFGGDASVKWYRDPKMADAPVVGVTWFEVKKFVDWLGCRLPTELEWEYAARGVKSLIYPWGNEWKPDWCAWSDNSGGKPASVSSKPEGASWVGARHLSGNVGDWVSSEYQPYPYKADDGRDNVNRTDVLCVLRGGSFSDASNFLRAADRNWNYPDFVDYDIGFRCARSL